MRWLKRLAFVLIALSLSALTGIFAFQTRLIYFPDDRDLADCRLPAPTSLLEIGAERALFTPADGTHLVVFFHGNAGSACNWRYLGANHLYPIGYDTLVLEYPGYGGDLRSASKAEIDLALPVFHDWVAAQDYETVTVFGYSLGSGIGSEYVRDYGADQVLLFAPFDSVYGVVRAMGYKIPRAMLTEDYDNIDALSQTDAPIYILHGSADGVIPAERSANLLAALSDLDKDVAREVINGVGHEGLFDSPEFDIRLARILRFTQEE